MTTLRSNETLNTYLSELTHTPDRELCDNIRRLLAGDETMRSIVETALDQVDSDAAKYAE